MSSTTIESGELPTSYTATIDKDIISSDMHAALDQTTLGHDKNNHHQSKEGDIDNNIQQPPKSNYVRALNTFGIRISKIPQVTIQGEEEHREECFVEVANFLSLEIDPDLNHLINVKFFEGLYDRLNAAMMSLDEQSSSSAVIITAENSL